MRLLLRAGLILGLATAACKDSIGPKSLANPQETTAQIAAFESLFDVSALNSFSALSGDIAPVAPYRVAALRAVAAASNPLASQSALRPFAKGLESSRMLRQLIPTMTATNAAALFPPEVLGKTFEWNPTLDRYEQTARTGAPGTGVRFILYAVDVLTNLPVEPVVEVGYVDLVDESSSSVAKVHVTVAGVGGAPVYVDYTVSLEGLSASSARLATAGYITNGAGSPDTLLFSGSITASGSQTSATVTQDVRLDVNSRDIHVRLWEKVILTETTAELRIYYLFRHGSETVTLEGGFDLDSIGETVSGEITAKVNGGLFATCTVEASPGSFTYTCRGADADGLNADEHQALQALGDGVAHTSVILGGIFAPGLNVLGAGF
jgi:hypothetical protein